MTENKGHVHAANSAEYSKDMLESKRPWELWEQKYNDDEGLCTWFNCTNHPEWDTKYLYRRKPITKKYILDLPEPMNEVPEYKSTYYLVTSYGACPHGWRGHDGELKALKAGICFKTVEDAQAFYDALKTRQPATD